MSLNNQGQTVTSSSPPPRNGYKNNQTQLHSIPTLFSHISYDYINSAIISEGRSCNKLDHNDHQNLNYIIANTNRSMYDIHVAEFKLSSSDSSSYLDQIEICREFSHDLRELAFFSIDENLENFPVLYELKSERSFLCLCRSKGIGSLLKIDIESGTVLWKKKDFNGGGMVEDERGILYVNSYSKNCIMLYETKSGNYLSSISIKFGNTINNSIGFDIANNILITTSSGYVPHVALLSKNGKWLKSIPFLTYNFNLISDPYNNKLYFSDFPYFRILIKDPITYTDIGTISIPPEIRTFAFLQNYNFLLLVGKQSVYLYD